MVGRIVKYSAKFTGFSRYRGIRILLHRSLMVNRRYMIYEARTRKQSTTLVTLHIYTYTSRSHTHTHARTHTLALTRHRFSERTVRAYTRARVESHLKSRDGTAGSLVRQRVTGTLHPRNYRRVSALLRDLSSNLLLHFMILKQHSERNYAFLCGGVDGN